MSFKDAIKNSFIENFSNGRLNSSSTLLVLAVTLLIGFYIFCIYKVICRETFYSKDFNISLVAVAIITAAIILTIQSSIVISLGMVGALSIVRFRTAIKEPLDIAFLFWSIAVGIVLAAGLIPLAVIGSVLIGIFLLVFVNRKSHMNPYIVVIDCADQESEQKATQYLAGQVNRLVIKSKTVRKGAIELNAEVRMKDANTDFINVLADIDGVSHAVLVSYNGDYMG